VAGSLPDRVRIKYYLYQIARSAYLAGPIWVLFLTDRGVSYTQVGLLDTAFVVVIILAEAPTGYLGDRIGRRNSLLVSAGLNAVGAVFFGFASSFGPFLVLYCLLAFAQTFRSGTESAWLYDILKENYDSETFSAVQGRGKAFGKISGAGAALAGGALGSIDLALPWILSGVSIGVAFFILLTFPETDAAGGDNESFDIAAAVKAVRMQLLGSPLTPFILYSGIFYAVLVGLNYLIQPVARGAGISVAQIGVLYASFRVLSAGVSTFSGQIQDRIGSQTWFRVVPLVVGVAFAAVLPFEFMALPAVFLMKAVNDVSETLEHQYINNRIEGTGRATVLSGVALVHAMIAIPFQLSVGGVADLLGPVETTGVFGVVLIAGAGVGLLVGNALTDGVLLSDTTTVRAEEVADG